MTLIKSISGIRGTIGGTPGESLTPLDVLKFTAAYGTWIKNINPENKSYKIVIGRDARPSGSSISQIVSSTLQNLGIDVVDAGLSTTPTVEMGVVFESADGGIILTASHNPIQWNALKLLNGNGEFISGDDGKEILKIAEEENFSFVDVTKIGRYISDNSILAKHVEAIVDLPLVNTEAIKNSNFSVAFDAVNSSGSIAIPEMLSALGVTNIKAINGTTDGLFAHNPEPLPENLTTIIGEVSEGNYDLGIVVDPDVDRLAFISEDGTYFGEEFTLVAVADYILRNTPGNTVSNLSSSQALRIITEKSGNNYFASAVGEVNVVNKMKSESAVIGGEGNGGIIYPELHFGRDALVGIALFLSYLAETNLKASQLRASYPDLVISKNKVELTDSIDVDELLARVENSFSEYEIDKQDGIKIIFPEKDSGIKEWVHLRKSNTEPIIRIYAESDSEENADSLAARISEKINEISMA